jgi:hypothetical protein
MKYLALLLITFSLTACHRKNTGPLIEELRRESALSKAEQDECIRYQDAAPRVPEGQWDNPTHRAKAEALAALAYLEKRPRLHPHSDRIEEIVRGHFAELSELPDQDEVIASMRYEAGACGIFVNYQHGLKLMADPKAFKFSAAERGRAEKLVRELLTEKTGTPVSIIARAIQLTLMKKYLELGDRVQENGALIRQAQAAIDAMEADRPKMTSAAKEAERQAGGNTILSQKFERQVQRRMMEQHAALVQAVFHP